MFDTEFGTVFYAQFIDEAWWHQRLVLCRTVLGNYIVSPEGYVHEETWTDYEDAIRCGRWELPARVRDRGDPYNSFRPADLVDGSAFVRRALASFPAVRRVHRALAAAAGDSIVPRTLVEGAPAYFQRVSPGTKWFIQQDSALGARGDQIEVEVDDETVGYSSCCLLRRRFVTALLGARPPVGLHIPCIDLETSEEDSGQDDRVPPAVGDPRGTADGSTSTAGSASERHLFLGGSRPSGAALVSFLTERVGAEEMPVPKYGVAFGRRKRREERELLAAASTPTTGGKRKKPDGKEEGG